MNEIIFEDLRFEIEQKINASKSQIDKQCYSQHKQTLSGAPSYAECYQNKVKELAIYEQKAKLKLLYLNLLLRDKGPLFNLTEEVGRYVKEFEIQGKDII